MKKPVSCLGGPRLIRRRLGEVLPDVAFLRLSLPVRPGAPDDLAARVGDWPEGADPLFVIKRAEIR
jgi:hypothetical protein